jgi:two-component system, OmpR family, sensor kinase
MFYSKSEKRSILKFLFLYYGSSFTLTFVIAFLSYHIFYLSILQTEQEKMKSYALELSSKIINAHMMDERFVFEPHTHYLTLFLDKEKKSIFGDKISKTFQFSDERFYKKDNALYLIDTSAHNHLGVDSIVVVLQNSQILFKSLRYSITLITIVVILVIGFVGFFLTKMFIKPIQNERIKLDDFIKDTTHELNTPISSLLLSISAFEKNPSKNMARIKASTYRISDIYANLTFLLLGDSDKTTLEMVDFGKIIKDELLIQNEYIEAKKIEVVFNVDHLDALMDKESAKRLISNLLSNAIKYNKPHGQIVISSDGKNLIFEDNGIGIDQEKLSVITNRYVRANSYAGGFGIGLDIVNKITKKYNLSLMITSNKGNGVRVEIGF